MYDWAASAVHTTIMVAVFPIYFVRVAGAELPASGATQRLAIVNTLALVIIALISPILGAISDYRGIKKRLLAVFMFIGVAAVGGMFFIRRGEIDLASALFLVALIGVAGRRCFRTLPGPGRSTGCRAPAMP
jgi:UMF1 family MFS transporter